MGGYFDAMKEVLDRHVTDIETTIKSEVMAAYGPIGPLFEFVWPEVIETLPHKEDTLSIMLDTAGGSAEIVERLVNITRKHYQKVNFIIPNQAMSAGTIFCMSGDRIFMEYSSVLGPIDPQVMNAQQHWVPALGYLEKYDELRKKAENDTISNAEFALLSKMDLAEITQYEQQKELTITLLKTWLVKYKFKDWTVHESDPAKLGQKVTDAEKEKRAAEIADKLQEYSTWHTHGRKICLDTLKNDVRIKIDDYSSNETLREAVRKYYKIILEYVWRSNLSNCLHHREYLSV